MELSFNLNTPDRGPLGIGALAHIPDEGQKEQDTLILRDKDPIRFVHRLATAVQTGREIWLADPSWGTQRRQEMESLIQENPRPGHIMIPTGGTSGRLCFAVHTYENLRASAEAFLEFYNFQNRPMRGLCCLPLHHVSGLMQVIRCALSRGTITFSTGGDPRDGLPHGYVAEGVYLPLVPTQLKRLMEKGAGAWLARFACIPIGGGAANATLLEQAREQGLRLSPCYGMTETAAMVTALTPDDFLCFGAAGGVGKPMPHVQLGIRETAGVTHRGGISGQVSIRCSSLCKGLIPGPVVGDMLETNDCGYLDAHGCLHLRGRIDRIINSGGLKLDPSEVEEVVLSSAMIRDAAAIGLPDADWGEALTLFYVPVKHYAAQAKEELLELLRDQLGPSYVPKHFVQVEQLPRNQAGKLDRVALQKLALH